MLRDRCALAFRVLMCSPQLSLLSKIMPRNLTLFLNGMIVLLIVRFVVFSLVLRLWKMIASVFWEEKQRPCCDAHFVIPLIAT